MRPTQITQFYTGCLAPESTGVTCAPFGGSGPAANQACAACIVTFGNASAYGPLIQDTGALSINVAGCLEITGDLACAQAVQAVEMCLLAACEANCPVTDNPSLAVFKACKQQAMSGGCASFATPADTCRAAQAGGPGAECLQGATFEEQYNVVVPVFCGAAAS